MAQRRTFEAQLAQHRQQSLEVFHEVRREWAGRERQLLSEDMLQILVR